MRRLMPLLMCSLVLLAGCARDQSAEVASLKQEVARLEALAGPPPARSRCALPAQTRSAPAYQLKMFDLAGPFGGMILRLNEGDRKAARALFDAFKAQYTASAALVPEWQPAFPMQPVEELGALIEQAEPEKVMAAVGRGRGRLPRLPRLEHAEDAAQIPLGRVLGAEPPGSRNPRGISSSVSS